MEEDNDEVVVVKVGLESEDRCDCGRKLTGESARARDSTGTDVTKVRNDYPLVGCDLARIGELGSVDVC